MTKGLALFALALGACSNTPAFVVLNVDISAELAPAIAAIAVGFSADHLQSTSPTSTVFPVAITVTAAKASEQRLWVEGRDSEGRVVGRGQVVARFARAGRPSASVQLLRACDSDITCTDGSFCNGVDVCQEGVCVTSPPPCGSNVACIVSTCVELGSGDGRCDVVVDHAGCGVGNYCNPTLGCVPGLGCLADVECQDDSICNGDERCLNYGCAGGTPPPRDDGDDCTADGCNETDGVFHVPMAGREGNTCVKTGIGREICLTAAGGCAQSRCGDGFVDTGATPKESCDEGAANASAWALAPHCNTTCDGDAPYCGDGMVDAAEYCDDGNTVDDHNDCSPTCGCAGIACQELTWAGRNGSDFGPWDTYLSWGSLGCQGLPPAASVWSGWVRSVAGELRHAMLVPAGSSYNLVIRRWTGGSLEAITTIPTPMSFASAAWDAAGNPWVTWTDGLQVYVSRWDGSAWVEVGAGSMIGGGISNTTVRSWIPMIAYATDTAVYVLWENYVFNSTQGDLYLRRFDGTAWVELGTNSASGNGITNTPSQTVVGRDLALDAAGYPVVAWSERASNQEIYVKRWNGSAWVEVGTGSSTGGGISNDSGISRFPSLAIDGTGQILVVWENFILAGYTSNTYVRRFNGVTWMELGSGSASGNGISGSDHSAGHPNVTLDGADRPIVVWTDAYSNATFFAFDGSAWQPLVPGSSLALAPLTTTADATTPAAVDGAGAYHFVWRTWTPAGVVTKSKYFVASAWRSHVAGTAVDAEALSSPGFAFDPRLVSDGLGRITVAWTEGVDQYSNDGGNIFIRRLDGGRVKFFVSDPVFVSSATPGSPHRSSCSDVPSACVRGIGWPVSST